MSFHRHLTVLLGVFLAAVSPLALRAVDIQPFTLPVSFSFRIVGVGNGIMTVYGEGGSPSVGQTTYNANTESDSQSVLLCPGKSYNLNFQASGPSSYWLSLIAPSGYQFYVNGVPKDYISNNPGGGGYSYNYSIQIRPINGDGFLPASSFTGIDISQAVSWQLGLGGARAGHSVGRVGFRERDLSNSPAVRDHLFYTPPINSTQVNIIYDGPSNQRIRQIVSPRVMVDFVDVTGGYEIRYYNYDDTTWVPATPIYTINAGKTPWHTISVISSAANQLTITETEETNTAGARVSNLALTSGSIPTGNYVWTLLEGGPGNAWLRQTTHTSTASAGVRQNYVRVTTMNGATAGALVSETESVYHTYAWGEDLYQVIANPNIPSGTTALTTTYAYYETAPVSGSETSRGSYGRVKSVTGPDGNWTASQYYDDWNRRGQPQYQFQPYQDAPVAATLDPTQGRVKFFDFVADPTGRYRRPTLVQETVNNVTTAKTVLTYDNSADAGLARIKANLDNYKDGTYSHRTHTEVIDPLTADLDQSGEPCVRKNPDQSQISWGRTAGNFDVFGTRAFTVSSTGIFWRILRVNGTTNATGAESQNSYAGQGFDPIYLVPNKSTMDVTVLDYAGVPLRTQTLVYTGAGGWSAAFNTVDSYYDTTRTNRLTSSTAQNGATTSYTYANGYLGSMVDGAGIQTQYAYDALGRTATVTKTGAVASGIHAAQADRTTTYAYDGASRSLSETVSAAGTAETIVTSHTYDLAGRLTGTTPPGLSATTVTYNPAARTQTATAPDGGTTIQTTCLDGRLKSTTGTAVVAAYYAYGVETDGRQFTQVNAGTATSARQQKNWTDWLGRPLMLQKPGFSPSSQAAYVEQQFYDNTTGQLTQATRTGMAPTLYVYNTLGALIRSGLNVDNAAALVLASNERITDTDVSFETYNSALWLRTTTTGYPFANSATAITTSLTRQRLTGFATGVRAETQTTDAEGNTIVAVTSLSGKLATTQTTVPGLSAGDQYDYAYNGRASATTGHDGLTTTIQYDPLGRQWKATDTRSLVTTMAYTTGTAMPYTTTDPANNVVSTIAYDPQGRTAWTRDALGKYTRYAYNPLGQVTNQWGDGTYPVAYGYDATYGDRTSMSTYRSAPTGDSATWPSVGVADTTTWTMDVATALLWKKTDATGKVVQFDYNVRGQTLSRKWARMLTTAGMTTTPVTTTYGYDGNTGELLTQTYNDTAEAIPTPAVTYTYTRLGQTGTVADGTGTRTFNYDGTLPWRLNSEALDPGFYTSRVISRNYDNVSGSGGVYGPYTPGTFKGRYTGYDLGIAGNTTRDQHIAYTTSNLGRFVGVDTRTTTGTARDYIYNYFSSSSLLGGYTMGSLSVIRGYEAQRNVLTSIDSQWSAASYTRYDYTSNVLGQRVTAKQSGSAFADYGQGLAYSGTYNVYNYDARGELQTTARYRGDSPVTTPSAADELPAMRFEYRYDSIGNRTTAGATGTTGDDNYIANALNQYTAKDNKTVKVLGTAGVGVNVAVVGAPATGKVDHAWGANLVPANSAGPVMAAATVNAAIPGGGTGGQDLLRTDSSRNYFVPQLSQALTYDADGNLTGDGVWTYTYNAENRLVRMNTLLNAGFTGMDVRIDFKYDYQGRRVEKSIFDYNLNTQTLDQRYIYDANNLIAQTDASGNLQRTFAWGLDLTGSLTAAGGVGALLEIGDLAAGKTLSVTYDGNGNVAGLVNVVSGALEAAYEYDPSGNLLRLEGTYAKSNPVRFSTKWQDDETGLIYYGLRYYSPSLGRFINKDPIEEKGGLNLYAFCGNNGVNRWDLLGQIVPGIYSPSDGYNFDPYGGDGGSSGGIVINFNPGGFVPTSRSGPPARTPSGIPNYMVTPTGQVVERLGWVNPLPANGGGYLITGHPKDTPLIYPVGGTSYVFLYDKQTNKWIPVGVATSGNMGPKVTPTPTPSDTSTPTISAAHPWTSSDFANHFLEGSGTGVTLDQAGLTTAVKYADSTRVALGRFGNQIAQEAQVQATALGVGTHEFTKTFDRTYNFESVAWSIRDANLKGSFGGAVTVGSDGSYTYSGSATIHFYDSFNDPYEIGHLTGIDVNLGGTVYPITGSWSENYNGSGAIPRNSPTPPPTDAPVIYRSPRIGSGNPGGVLER